MSDPWRDFEWGGPDVASRSSRLDAAYDAYEERHRGDGTGHLRPYHPGEDVDTYERTLAALAWLEEHRPVNEGPS